MRCAELCGIWHGSMFDHGNVVTPSAFTTWIHEQQTKFAATTKVLPKYSKTYLPEPTRRGRMSTTIEAASTPPPIHGARCGGA